MATTRRNDGEEDRSSRRLPGAAGDARARRTSADVAALIWPLCLDQLRDMRKSSLRARVRARRRESESERDGSL